MKNYILIFSAMILIFSSCLQVTVSIKTPEQYEKDLKIKRSYKDGYVAGRKNGLKAKKKRIYRKGLEAGIEEGKKIRCFEEFDESLEEIKNNRDLILNPDYFLDPDDAKNYYSRKCDTARERVRVEFYVKGRREGYNRCHDSLHEIFLKEGQMADYNSNATFDLSAQYHEVVDALFNTQMKYPYPSVSGVNKAIDILNQGIVDYLIKAFSLNSKEVKEIREEYERLTKDRVWYSMTTERIKRAYEFYKLSGKGRGNVDATTYFFEKYHISQLVFDGFSTTACLLADELLTYVKNNSQYGKIHGLSISGSVCEVVQQTILPEVREAVLKLALTRECEGFARVAEERIKRMLIRYLADRRQDYKRTGRITSSIGSQCKESLSLKIRTDFEVLFDTSSVRVEVGKEQLIIHVSDKPVFHRFYQQNYEVIRAKYEVSYNHKDITREINKLRLFKDNPSLKDLKNQTNTVEKEIKIPFEAGNFEAAFDAYKPKEESDLKNPLRRLESSRISAFKSQIAAYFEPILALPGSYYSVVLNFGGHEETILQAYRSK